MRAIPFPLSFHLFPVYHLVLKTRDFLWSREGKERPKGHRKERVPSLSLVHFLILSSLDNERENEGKRENRKDRKERKWRPLSSSLTHFPAAFARGPMNAAPNPPFYAVGESRVNPSLYHIIPVPSSGRFLPISCRSTSGSVFEGKRREDMVRGKAPKKHPESF